MTYTLLVLRGCIALSLWRPPSLSMRLNGLAVYLYYSIIPLDFSTGLPKYWFSQAPFRFLVLGSFYILYMVNVEEENGGANRKHSRLIFPQSCTQIIIYLSRDCLGMSYVLGWFFYNVCSYDFCLSGLTFS